MWARTGWLVLVGIISELMVAHASGPQPIAARGITTFSCEIIKTPTFVSVAKLSESMLAKSVEVENFTPNIKMQQAFLKITKVICSEVAIVGTSHFSAAWDHITSIYFLAFDWKVLTFSIGINLAINEPSYVSGWQISDVGDFDMGDAMLDSIEAIDRFNSQAVNGEISALKDFSVALLPFGGSFGKPEGSSRLAALESRYLTAGLDLPFTGLIESISGYPKKNGRDAEHDGESGDKFMFVLFQKVSQPDDASISESEERAAKSGAVIFFTAVFGCGWVYWLARRKPRNRRLKK